MLQIKLQTNKISVTTKSYTNAKLHSRSELHLDADLQNEVEAHSDSEISVHERDVEIPNRDVHSNSKVERPNEETRVEPILSKYVKRHNILLGPLHKIKLLKGGTNL